jgi:nucleotide sugar dehydrogenase
MKIGVIGNGFVGKATQLLKGDNIEMLVYDIDPNKCIPKNFKLEMLKYCRLIFVCVPTPMKSNGECYLGMVEDAISNVRKYINEEETFIVLRSTVPPGTSDNLNTFFMPEFLTEKNWENDFKECSDWIFGLTKDENRNKLFKQYINDVINQAKKNESIDSNTIHFINTKEAEMMKYFRNISLAVKVGVCNEIESYCSKMNIDYNIVSKLGCLDKRITSSHTQVPGHDGKRGFGGTCFPKDINSLRYEMSKNNVEPVILSAVIKRNGEIDRSDDVQEKGRGIV